MNSIIQYLLIQNQYLLQIISFFFKIICKYIPLRQWIFDDSNSPEYQKLKVDEPPLIKKEKLQPQERWYYKDFIAYIKWKYDVIITPVKRRGECNIPDDYICPHCGAPKAYLYRNNGSNDQVLCKVCGKSSSTFVPDTIALFCPHCSHTLVAKKDRKFFRVHKCVNPKCPYYLNNLKVTSKNS